MKIKLDTYINENIPLLLVGLYLILFSPFIRFFLSWELKVSFLLIIIITLVSVSTKIIPNNFVSSNMCVYGMFSRPVKLQLGLKSGYTNLISILGAVIGRTYRLV